MTEQCFPNPGQIKHIDVSYNGHGTAVPDVIIALGIAAAVVLVVVLWVLFYCRYEYLKRRAT